MNTYTVRSWENAEREYYLNKEHRYFVSVMDENSVRVPQFSRNLDKDHWHPIYLNAASRDVRKINSILKELIEWKKKIPEGQHIVLHCSMGMIRSPSFALALLLQDGYSPKDAFKYLKSQKPLEECYDNEMEFDAIIIEMIDEYFSLNGDLVEAFFERFH